MQDPSLSSMLFDAHAAYATMTNNNCNMNSL